MSFIAEKIVNEKDKNLLKEKGFTYMTGNPITDARNWVIDRDREIIMVSRGGGSLDIPKGYSMYMDGMLVDIVAYDTYEGDQYENNLRIYWDVESVVVPLKWLNMEDTIEKLTEVIREAFIALSYRGVKESQVLSVTVDISAIPVAKLK